MINNLTSKKQWFIAILIGFSFLFGEGSGLWTVKRKRH